MSRAESLSLSSLFIFRLATLLSPFPLPRHTHTQPAPPSPTHPPHTMADTTPTTFNDLPDDMLHEGFGLVFDEDEKPTIEATAPPQGTHLALRSVCRR